MCLAFWAKIAFKSKKISVVLNFTNTHIRGSTILNFTFKTNLRLERSYKTVLIKKPNKARSCLLFLILQKRALDLFFVLEKSEASHARVLIKLLLLKKNRCITYTTAHFPPLLQSDNF